ncbi:MAG: cysteinyl-tRNA synthetase [Anaerolineae bacterium]|nr:cysteinyl-tRNA synthetase [Anaerolineae bacterium]
MTARQVLPGKIALFGSGETAPAGRRVHAALFRQLEKPIRVAILETPAGFQPNSDWVAGRLAEFVERSLQDFDPQVTVVPARRRDGFHSTDDREIATPLLTANYIFAGPGSPSYAARHLAGSWAWQVVVTRQRRGAALALASAAAIAAGRYALPVYEIYKVGDDLHWLPGLDLLGPYGLELAIVTHWDNQDGGETLDTRCAFMGMERMARLEALLPATTTLLGIDERTAVVVDFVQETAQVMGQGSATVRRDGKQQSFTSGQTFDLNMLGKARGPALKEGLPAEVVEAVLAEERVEKTPPSAETPPPEVASIIRKREAARQAEDWTQADALREELARIGYLIEDTSQGPRWRRVDTTSQ